VKHTLFWIVFSVLFIYQMVRIIDHYGWWCVGGDAAMYWRAGSGVLEHRHVPESGTKAREVYDALPMHFKNATGYLYGESWRAVFSLFSWMSLDTFRAFFVLGCIASYVYLVARFVNEVPFGWSLALLVTRHVETVIISGNISSLLAVALLHPLGMVLAGSVKLHLAGIATVCAFAWCAHRRVTAFVSDGQPDLYAALGDASASWKARILRGCHRFLRAARVELPRNQTSSNRRLR